MSRDSASTSSRSSRRVLLPMFWIGCDRSCTRPAAIAAEHRLPLLALDVFLQLDQAIGHRVERVAELAELVAGADVDARVELRRRRRRACRAAA